MAKASKKRAKKKAVKRKSSAKTRRKKKVVARRKSSAKKSVARKSAKRKLARRKPAKRRSAKRRSAKRRPAKRKQITQEPVGKQDSPWPVVFAAMLAFLMGLAAIWHFTDFSMAANAATDPALLSIVSAPVSANGGYVGCETVQAADTWLTLMYPGLVPGAT